MAAPMSKNPVYDFHGKISAGKAVPFGLQHVLAMFVDNIAPHSDRYRCGTYATRAGGRPGAGSDDYCRCGFPSSDVPAGTSGQRSPRHYGNQLYLRLCILHDRG